MSAIAWRITDWDERYEVNKDGNQFAVGGGQEYRKRPLDYVRFKCSGLAQGEGYRDLAALAGPQRLCRAFGLFAKMLEVAASAAGGRRGWLLTGRDEVMDAGLLARKLCFDDGQVAEDMELLYKVGWIEQAQCEHAVEMVVKSSPTVVLGVAKMENVEVESSQIPVNAEQTNETAEEDCGKAVSCESEKEEKRVNIGNLPLSQKTARKCGASERNRKEKNLKLKPKPKGSANEGEDVGSGLSPPGRQVGEKSNFEGLDSSASDIRDSGFGDRGSGPSGDGSGFGVRDSAVSGFGAGGGIQGANGTDSSGRAGTDVDGNQGQLFNVVMARAVHDMEETWRSMLAESPQGRADRTTVWNLLEAAWEVDGERGVKRLLKLASEKQRARGLRNPLAAWVKAGNDYLKKLKTVPP
jgi:hypothetical protein